MGSKSEKENDTLGNRLKGYEAVSTSRTLPANLPIYARIDGRAFHSFCRGLEKPFSRAFIEAMQKTCAYLVEETGAILGYVQSDEISLGWKDSAHCPFNGRVQKLESNIASLASGFFVFFISEQVRNHVPIYDYCQIGRNMLRKIPSFDCRVFTVPDMEELANCFLWRENDAIKNSITGMASYWYSHNELQGKNSDEKIRMMKEKGHDFYEETYEPFMRGTFLSRENYVKLLTDEELNKIPSEKRESCGVFWDEEHLQYACIRRRVAQLMIPYRLTDISNKCAVLFERANAEKNKENVTFTIATF